MKNKEIFSITLVVASCYSAFAQQSGTTSYSFMDIPYGAKIGSVGGVNTSLYNNDPTLFLSNPALISDAFANRATVNYTALPMGVGLSSATYSYLFNDKTLWSAGIQYLSYGKIDGYDDTGNPTSTFNPNAYTITVSHVRHSNNFRLGASLKQVGSYIYAYGSSATLVDIGGVFIHPSNIFTIGMTIKNVGIEWKKISNSDKSKLPFDLQVGTTIKPLYMPFRFSFTIYKLNQWDLILPNKTTTNPLVDNLMRHLVIGTELILNKHINILFGYNHLRRKELKIDSENSFSGFSLGLDIKTKLFELIYAYSGYSVAGNVNMFTLSITMNELVKK